MKVASFEGFDMKDKDEKEQAPSQPLRPLHLPSGAVRGADVLPPPLPRPEISSAEKAAREAAGGVLLFSREIAPDDEEDEETEDTGSARPSSAQPSRPIPAPRPKAEDVFAYPEAAGEPAETSAETPAEAWDYANEQSAKPLESSARPVISEILPEPPLHPYTPEPLPPIAGESAPMPHREEIAAELPFSAAPSYESPAPMAPEWTPAVAPEIASEVASAAPIVARAAGGHGGGPPGSSPGGRAPGAGGGSESYPGGPVGPDGPDLPPPPSSPYGAEYPVPEEPPRPVTPASGPSTNANILSNGRAERVAAADWPARVLATVAFFRAGKRKINKRVDKLESRTKRGHQELHFRQERFAAEQHQQNRDINRLQTEQQQQRLRTEKQRPPQAEAVPLTSDTSAEQQQREEALRQQGLEVQPDQRMRQETWLWSVVDKHGRPVQDVTHYGESFQRERQKEAVQDRVSATASPGPTNVSAGAALGTGAGIGATQNIGVPGPGPAPSPTTGALPAQPAPYAPSPPITYAPAPSVSYQDSLPSGMTTPVLPPGSPTHADAQHQLPATAEEKRPVSSLVFWVMLAIIIAAFFIAALI